MELSLFDDAPAQAASDAETTTVEAPQPAAPAFTTKDAGGSEAALAFAQLVHGMNLADRLTTGGKLDLLKIRRAANLLNRGVASDRPLPTEDDYESATWFLMLPSDPTFANSFTKRGDDVPEEGARALETLPADTMEGATA